MTPDHLVAWTLIASALLGAAVWALGIHWGWWLP